MAMSVARERPESGFLAFLRVASLIAMPVGAAGSIASTIYAGRHNRSHLLIALFVAWVLSPFVLLGGASRVSKQWSDRSKAALYCVSLVLALAPLVIYGYVALGPPRPQQAFAFLVVPAASWLLIAIALAIAYVSGSRDRSAGRR
jgi:hypothetical protein